MEDEASEADARGIDEPSAEPSQQRCFVITPIGVDDSKERRSADGVYETALRPVLREMGYRVSCPREMSDPGAITNQIVERLVEDDLVVANLTGLNPNVMYELAVRHAVRKPVVVVVEVGTRLPFDIAADRALYYVDDMLGVEELRPRLREAVVAAQLTVSPDNPIYRGIATGLIRKADMPDVDRLVVESLGRIEGALLARIPLQAPSTDRRVLRIRDVRPKALVERAAEELGGLGKSVTVTTDDRGSPVIEVVGGHAATVGEVLGYMNGLDGYSMSEEITYC